MPRAHRPPFASHNTDHGEYLVLFNLDFVLALFVENKLTGVTKDAPVVRT